jgi:hypothetical protein
MIDAERIEKFCLLLDHFCRVVDLLDEIDADDAEIIYAELDRTDAEINALLGAHHGVLY